MEAYTVLDSVNKYRHGVLVGNFVEDKFGNDLHQKGPNPDAPKLTSTHLAHSLASSLHATDPLLAAQHPTRSHFTATQAPSHYARPESTTTYAIFHAQTTNPTVPLARNDPRLEEQQEREGSAYASTRQQLANKFTRVPEGPGSLLEEVPDILTGEVLKGKGGKGEAKVRSINPFGTYSLVRPEIQRFEEVEYRKMVCPSHKGEQRDILFGHGLALEDFQQRQLSTTYDLIYKQKVMPQTQINSFYQPDPRESARQYCRDTLYEKNHQSSVAVVGDQAVLAQEKATRPYQPYTATYDANHRRHEYLRK